MRMCRTAAILVLGLCVPARADPPSCLDAARAAEAAWHLPPDLVAAIGRTESGRADPATGQVAPWPWTVNAEGEGHYFPSLPEAVGFVRALLWRGVRMVDVGCFQIDLFYHPQAFASLEDAFDPAANASYAARFLSALHARTGDWASAVAAYHSSLPEEGERYRLAVMRRLGGAAPDAAGPDTVGALLSGGAAEVHVIVPGAGVPRLPGALLRQMAGEGGRGAWIAMPK